MNNVLTEHKFQGMSKDKFIVFLSSFMPNWIFVVLSHVHTLNGLFLLKPLLTNCSDKFKVFCELQAFERRVRDLETYVIKTRGLNMAALENKSHDNMEWK
jgi:hypothetical protein